jgi:copper chaperone CopZ
MGTEIPPCSKDPDWLRYFAMANTKEMVFQAEGITCSGCAGDMETILREVEGIREASVNFTSEIIRVRYDPLSLDRKAVFSAVRSLGYKVRILEEK